MTDFTTTLFNMGLAALKNFYSPDPTTNTDWIFGWNGQDWDYGTREYGTNNPSPIN